MDSSFDAFLSIRFFHYSFYQGLYMKGIQFLRASSKPLIENYDKKNFKVLLRITKLTLTSTYLIMEQIVKILLLKVFTSVHPTGFWCVNFTAPGTAVLTNGMVTWRYVRLVTVRVHIWYPCGRWIRGLLLANWLVMGFLSRRKLFLGSIYDSAGWLRKLCQECFSSYL